MFNDISAGWKAAGVALAAMFLGFLLISFYGIGIINDYRGKANDASEAQDNAKTNLDKVFAVLKNQKALRDQDMDAFVKFYPTLVSEKYNRMDKINRLTEFATQSNPSWNSKMSEKLFTNIESQFTEMSVVYKNLRKIKKDGDNMMDKFPSSFFLRLAGEKRIEIVIPIEESTAQAFATGRVNNNLFVK